MANRYTCLWQFDVSDECTADFEQQYGPTGVWVQLFRQSPDYIETLLLKDLAVTGRYLTLDLWRSQEAFHAFKSEFGTQYAQLDKKCEGLTLAERSLGSFSDL